MEADNYIEIYEGKQVCCTCKHFHQHYSFDLGHYHLVWCGHCTECRMKFRKPDQTCGEWAPKEEEPVSQS